MEGGKELTQETVLFNTGKFVGSGAGIILFSLLFSLILNKLNFNKNTFIIVLDCAIVLHIMVKGMVKRRWL